MFGEFWVSQIVKSEFFEVLRVELQNRNKMNLCSITWLRCISFEDIKENSLVCVVTGRYVFGRSTESICDKTGLARDVNDLEIEVDEPFEPSYLTWSQMVLGDEVLQRSMVCLYQKMLTVEI